MNIIQKPVKNFTQGRGKQQRPKCVVIHIGDGSQQSIFGGKFGCASKPKLGSFTQTVLQKSTHYSIDYDGEIWQFVQEKDTAWGNGNVKNPTARIVKDNPGINPNFYSVSIEHAGFGSSDITEAQYQATAELVHSICQKWSIPMDRDHIIGHREIFCDKICPGKINLARIVDMAHAVQFSPPPAPSPAETIMKLQTQVSLLQRLVQLWAKLKRKQV